MATIQLEPEDFLYHVTTYRRLEGIAEHGLVRGRSRAIGASALDAHARRGIFLTALDGVFFWHARAEEHAEAGTDDLLEDGAVPVVLRVFDSEDLGELEEDDAGTMDASAEAWIAPGPIAPEDIEVWSGRAWVEVSDWERIDPEDGLQDMADEQDVEDDNEHVWVFVDSSPLIPPEARP